MDATIRRYEGTDTSRTAELSRKVGETLVPRLRELEGFRGYYAIEDGNDPHLLRAVRVGFAGKRGDEARRVLGQGRREGEFETTRFLHWRKTTWALALRGLAIAAWVVVGGPGVLLLGPPLRSS